MWLPVPPIWATRPGWKPWWCPLTELFQSYQKHQLDVIHLVYSGFVNTMRQEPRLETLLPIGESVLEGVSESSDYNWDYRYEPSPTAVLEYLVRRY